MGCINQTQQRQPLIDSTKCWARKTITLEGLATYLSQRWDARHPPVPTGLSQLLVLQALFARHRTWLSTVVQAAMRNPSGLQSDASHSEAECDAAIEEIKIQTSPVPSD